MRLYLVILFIAYSFTAFSQISHGGKPYSFSKTLLETAPTYTTEDINIQPFLAEDAVTDQHKDIPWRFGIIIPCNLNLNNSGLWTTLPNGDRIWKLIISSPNAKSINLNYDQFHLPEGAAFFIYNKSGVLGSFTSSNNKSNGEFATSLLKGNTVTLEYYEPKNQLGKGKIQVSSIVHGYRDLYSKIKDFGSSKYCQVNAVCDSTIWGDEIRSVVMILTGSNRFCSGALVNNVLQDGTPYVLTANHCAPSSNNIFMFNYQSSDCLSNIDGPTNQTINGCTIIANNAPSDFSLVKLSNVPPSNYNVFYAGWSAIDTPSFKSTGIHHPAGDVKKISHDDEQVASSGYYFDSNIDHWKVLDWNSGATEGGSSGSPLFNQSHQVVGQLHGGDAECGNNFPDYYGKFSVSWNTNSDTLKQLKYWLDPTNTGIKAIDGYDPNGSNLATDVAILSVIGVPKNICGDTINPRITIRNKGSNPLTSVDLYYTIDGNVPTLYNWTGNLLSYQTAIFSLSTFNLVDGNHRFTIYSTNPNNTLDQNLENDTQSINFHINTTPLFATLKIKTDDYGNELGWEIKDTASANIILMGGGYPDINGGATYTENLCLYEKCFSLKLTDSGNDGFCCGYGSGYILLTEDVTGDTLAMDSAFNSGNAFYTFCMGNANGINKNSFTIYPNPNDGHFTIQSTNQITLITVIDLLGKTIYKEKVNKNKTGIDLTSIDKGLYLVIIEGKDQKQNVAKILIK